MTAIRHDRRSWIIRLLGGGRAVLLAFLVLVPWLSGSGLPAAEGTAADRQGTTQSGKPEAVPSAPAASSEAAGTATKKFRLDFSADDELCLKLLHYFEENLRVLDFPQYRDAPWKRVDDDPMFIRWAARKDIQGLGRDFELNWAIFDFDNDGVEELVVRGTGIRGQGSTVYEDSFFFIKPGHWDDFINNIKQKEELNKILLYSLNWTRLGGGATIYPLRKHPRHLRHYDVERGSFYKHLGYLMPFRWKGRTLIAAYRSNAHYPNALAGYWGLVFAVQPDGRGDDVCYIHQLQKSDKR